MCVISGKCMNFQIEYENLNIVIGIAVELIVEICL